MTGVKDKNKIKTTRLKLHKTCHSRVRCVGEQLPYTELILYAVFAQPFDVRLLMNYASSIMSGTSCQWIYHPGTRKYRY